MTGSGGVGLKPYRRPCRDGHALAVAFFGFALPESVQPEEPLEQDGCLLAEWGLGAWDQPGWFVAVAASTSWGSDAVAGPVDPTTADPAWRALLERFSAARALPFQEPGWHLAGWLPG